MSFSITVSNGSVLLWPAHTCTNNSAEANTLGTFCLRGGERLFETALIKMFASLQQLSEKGILDGGTVQKM